MGDSLTKKQQKVYEFIESYIEAKGFGPTVREIAEGLSCPPLPPFTSTSKRSNRRAISCETTSSPAR